MMSSSTSNTFFVGGGPADWTPNADGPSLFTWMTWPGPIRRWTGSVVPE